MHPGGTLRPTIVPHSSGLQSCKGVRPLFSAISGRTTEKRGLTPLQRIALSAIRGYQILIRPLLTGSCRYLPTCSEYAAEAIVTYGALRGGWLGLKRVLRCHPFGGAGLDPVP
ncbi:MAG: membrane protein insertion efficiency factor YidD [Acidobacteria bacterium]|nr:MAG: membrane protein insertion efficiency factor YidD [Acidobacteriota bacterium]